MNPIDEKVQSYLVRARKLLGWELADMNKDTWSIIIGVAKLVQQEEHYAKKEEL